MIRHDIYCCQNKNNNIDAHSDMFFDMVELTKPVYFHYFLQQQ